MRPGLPLSMTCRTGRTGYLGTSGAVKLRWKKAVHSCFSEPRQAKKCLTQSFHRNMANRDVHVWQSCTLPHNFLPCYNMTTTKISRPMFAWHVSYVCVVLWESCVVLARSRRNNRFIVLGIKTHKASWRFHSMLVCVSLHVRNILDESHLARTTSYQTLITSF